MNRPSQRVKKMNEISATRWEAFWGVLDEIVSGPGTWQDKAAEVRRRAEESGSEVELEEFTSWFGDQN
jgi:hypothetical protein